MRVLFFGTPEFAVPSLRALVGEGFEVVSVVTRPDKPTGRHRSTATPSPVKAAALAEEIPVLEPERPSADDFLAQVRALAADIAAVVAYGHILKEDLLGVPRLGSVNVHASLLPALRGAAPIQRAILAGLAETGVTIMKMDAGLDTGPILHQVKTPIAPDETGGELSVRLSELGAEALVEALTLMDEMGLAERPQDGALATYAPKLTRDEEHLDWSADAESLARRIRAFDPTPGAFTLGRGRALKLFGARGVGAGQGGGDAGHAAAGEAGGQVTGRPGEVLVANEVLRIACGTGALEVSDVQPEGKARMTVRAFVNGRGIAVGDVLA